MEHEKGHRERKASGHPGYSSGAGSERDEPGSYTRRQKNEVNANDVSSCEAGVFSINNGISRRSGYLGPRPLSNTGECRMVMSQTQAGARKGDPVCYGDSVSSLTLCQAKVISSVVLQRWQTSKRARPKRSGDTCGWSASRSKSVDVQIDGEIAWLGLDLTLRYLVRAIGCNGCTRQTEWPDQLWD